MKQKKPKPPKMREIHIRIVETANPGEIGLGICGDIERLYTTDRKDLSHMENTAMDLFSICKNVMEQTVNAHKERQAIVTPPKKRLVLTAT